MTTFRDCRAVTPGGKRDKAAKPLKTGRSSHARRLRARRSPCPSGGFSNGSEAFVGKGTVAASAQGGGASVLAGADTGARRVRRVIADAILGFGWQASLRPSAGPSSRPAVFEQERHAH